MLLSVHVQYRSEQTPETCELDAAEESLGVVCVL